MDKSWVFVIYIFYFELSKNITKIKKKSLYYYYLYFILLFYFGLFSK